MGFYGDTCKKEVDKDGKRCIQTFIKYYDTKAYFLTDKEQKEHSKTHSSSKDFLLDEKEI